MSRRYLLPTVGLFATLLLAGCGGTTTTSPAPGGGTPAAESQSNTSSESAQSVATAAGLRDHFAKLQAAIRANDTATAAALTKAYFPDDASLAKAIKDATAIPKVVAMHAQFSSAPDADIARMFATDPSRTEIVVHGATTEEIAAYSPGSVAHSEFPGGAQQAAQSILQPGLTFYEIELLEPGKDQGMKYHLFYHDGKDWKMLGPVWRAL